MIETAALRRTVTFALAVLFTSVTLLYGVIWMYSIHWRPAASIGVEFGNRSLEIVSVEPQGPAHVAGVKPFDRLVAIDGRPVVTRLEACDALRDLIPGTPVRLTVRLAGLDVPRSFEVLPAAPRTNGSGLSWLGILASELARCYPVLLAILMAAVLLRRSDRGEAWLVALTTAGMIASAPLMQFYEHIPPGLRGFAVAYKVLAWGIAPAFAYHLLTVFPEPSPVDRRWPWLKSAGPAASLAVALVFVMWVLLSNGTGLPDGRLPTLGFWIGVLLWTAAAGLGLASLASSYRETPSDEDRRKMRIIFWGVGAAVGPALLVLAVAVLSRKPVGDLSAWIWLPAFATLCLLPLALGYAVLSRRVLDVRVILKWSARFLLVRRGSVALVLFVGGVLAVGLADAISARLQSTTRAASAIAAIAGTACGTLIVLAGIRFHRRIVDRIDRALFAGYHRTQQILRDLAGDLQAAETARELALRIEQQIEQALVPSSFALYLTHGENLKVERGDVTQDLEQIPLSRPLVPEAPRSVDVCDDQPALGAIGSLDRVAELGPDCLVPIGTSRSRLLGLLVLGPRRTEEPYSGEDKRLLASVAEQAALVLERVGQPSSPPTA
jgi:sigma-B regulation protein RsbU (phosphoserine phosphatase)